MAILDEFRLRSIHPSVFALSLPIRPASVRDSMFRAELFCKRIVQEGVIRSGQRALVVGRGPVGMTVLATLAKHRLKLVSYNTPPDGDGATIANCTTRILCPTTFDFPSPQWRVRRFPHDDSFTAELHWRASSAEDVLNRMSQVLSERIHPYARNCTFRIGELLSVKGHENEPSKVQTVLRTRLKDRKFKEMVENFDLVLICTGPGRDRVSLRAQPGGFAGFSFWSNADPLSQIYKGSTGRRVLNLSSAAGKRFLILGGGDGGIADFVRLLTGNPDGFDSLDDVALPPAFLAELGSLSRSMWKGYNEHEFAGSLCALLVDTQRRLKRLIDQTWEQTESIREQVHRLLLSPSERPFVQLAMPCFHFQLSYFGNRLMAQFLARAMSADLARQNGGLVPFRVAVNCTSIEGVDPNSHRCAGNAAECMRFRHLVEFEPDYCAEGSNELRPDYMDDCEATDTQYGPNRTATTSCCPEPFDRIILRLNTERLTSGLPGEIVDLINSRRSDPIRDALTCYIEDRVA